jgi:hypothetical protein
MVHFSATVGEEPEVEVGLLQRLRSCAPLTGLSATGVLSEIHCDERNNGLYGGCTLGWITEHTYR